MHDSKAISSETGATIEAILDRQCELFVQLEALSGRQGELIRGDRTDELLDVLARRQQLIDAIEEGNVRLVPYRQAWQSLLARLPEAEQARLRHKVERVADMAGRIALRDEEDRRLLQGRRDAVSAEMDQLTRGRGAVAAYSAPPVAAARFQDREA